MGHRLLATIGSAVLGGEPVDVGHFELGGFVGIEDFSSQASLGAPSAPEQHPQPSPVVGLRLGYLGRVFRHLDIGPEAELSFAPAWTGWGFGSGRDSYFAPVISYRAAALVRVRLPIFEPHALVGVGGQTLIAESPFVASDTDLVVYYGAGATIDVMPQWQIRVDGRRSMVPATNGGTTANYELLFGAVASLGGGAAKPHTRHDARVAPAPTLASGRSETCATVIAGTRGCPIRDQDRDGIADAVDKCPGQPEDIDQFQDSDGCPDPDNDGDGILDRPVPTVARLSAGISNRRNTSDGPIDVCPNRAETVNGFDDSDGCPDSIPAAMAAALDAARTIRFGPGRARLTGASKRTLDRVVVALRTPAAIHVVITARPDSHRAKLADTRAEVVKWYLVERGVPGDVLHIKVSAVIRPDGPPIEIAIAPE